MTHALASSGTIVTPDEKIGAANSFRSRRANRFSIPFVSIKESQNAETRRVAGNTYRPIFVPVIVAAAGQNHPDEKVAQLVVREIAKRQGVETELIGLANMASAKLAKAAAMILVVPEYNYGFPDLLKTFLDNRLPELTGRVVGICDLSPGWFGGSLLLESLLPMMRKSGLIPVFWDETLAKHGEVLGVSATPAEQAQRLDNFLQNLLWMAVAFRQRRETMQSN